ncbi:MAG: hypothetical protein PHR87_01590 [Sulfurospirillaceae bacterium]|nr:hypothetical protein [Sulfurospirillaceae bacterium]
MDALYMIVPIGVLLSLFAFLFFEKRAIQAKKSKDAQGIPPPSVEDFYAKFRRYNTLSNIVGFFVASYAISFVLAALKYNEAYGLIHALTYIFLTTFIGSIIIFILKFNKSILVKVFAAFLYGAPHIAAASLAFLTRYLLA